MSQIKQITDPLLIEKIERISIILEKMDELQTELKSLDFNLEIRFADLICPECGSNDTIEGNIISKCWQCSHEWQTER